MVDLRALVRTPLLRPSPLDRYRGIVGGQRHDHPHAVLFSQQGDDFAAVFGPVSVKEFLTLTGERFDGEGFEVVIESDTAAVVEEYLAASGWTCVEEEIAMALTEIPAIPAPPEALTIEAVNTGAMYEDYMTVVPGNRHWAPSLAAATDPDVGLFVGYTEGRPVATSRLVCYGDVAEITGVTTLADFRRRGYGRALTWAAVAEAQQRGCRAVMLTATEMGYPLYLRMGFRAVCAYRTYARPPAA